MCRRMAVRVVGAIGVAWIAMMSGMSEARTLFSGSFVNVAVERASVDVSVNYPGVGATAICGIELKAHVMVLNAKVWERVARDLTVTARSERRMVEVAPVVEMGYGPRLSYEYPDRDVDYGTLTIATRDGRTLAAYWREALSGGEKDGVIAVARHCPVVAR